LQISAIILLLPLGPYATIIDGWLIILVYN